MGGKGGEDQDRTTRRRLEPFESEEERLEALENFKRYVRTLRDWHEARRWKAKPEVRDFN